jgi:hypothetical protein
LRRTGLRYVPGIDPQPFVWFDDEVCFMYADLVRPAAYFAGVINAMAGALGLATHMK